MINFKTALLLILAAPLVAGCISGHRQLVLDTPSAVNSANQKGTIAIVTVTDKRHFENKPDQPSTPSAKGNVDSLSQEQKSRMIGRMRNNVGFALGDLALPNGDSVQHQVQGLIAGAFAERGFQVTNANSTPNTVSATVDQFWVWMTPSYHSAIYKAQVGATLTLTSSGQPPKTLTVMGTSTNVGMHATDANFKLTFTRAFQDFQNKLVQQLSTVGY